MKLRNKKTGEVGEPRIEYQEIYIDTENHMTYCYKTLSDVFDEWEDYEEPKQDVLSMIILTLTNFIENEPNDNVDIDDCKQMLEKLKAWKRLKDAGLEIKGWKFTPDMKNIKGNFIKIEAEIPYILENMKDLDILFGDE